MTAPHGTAQSEAALRARHGARARSAVDRAVAACRHARVDDSQAKLVPNSPESKAAHAVRLAGQAVDALAGSVPDAAADARCARNAAATATVAAQVALAHDGGGELAEAACRSALRASLAAAEAAGGRALGRDEELNIRAEDAEAAAVAAARAAGWI
ncbi:hypothetical protein AMK26_24150 [Streptomyces sp. CB03234]|uniref:hypothetical protein n=1 Tax=Streptomyces sp. (strain CB03234) TaxID=1703937 RepID=UPI000939B2E9|nr:hypothetical protein [Streptomyces sp. CB03234]OKK02685.1 hypothetical protein AMK26_24150 [Streptomyces sp. CB03234]